MPYKKPSGPVIPPLLGLIIRLRKAFFLTHFFCFTKFSYFFFWFYGWIVVKIHVANWWGTYRYVCLIPLGNWSVFRRNKDRSGEYKYRLEICKKHFKCTFHSIFFNCGPYYSKWGFWIYIWQISAANGWVLKNKSNKDNVMINLFYPFFSFF